MIQYKELKKLKDQGRELYEKIEATKKALRNNQHTESKEKNVWKGTIRRTDKSSRDRKRSNRTSIHGKKK